ncbi:putative aldo-keto reductase [Podospora aff. communis PSN243]|uniref:Aldo-keto reductase n=1 Tax=Podospora aff. communis PSN243 TaxID=3040156 RepID=A0AAV9GJX9_9PEZI|nr:putative aldo-keto reductase [Podospora aff. communis PSN243]
MAHQTLTLTSTAAPKNAPVPIPLLCFGTYLLSPTSCLTAIPSALTSGYRHIDTAQLYRNESAVGEVLRSTSIPRSEIFVTTKQGIRGETAEATYALAAESVRKIAGEEGYVDLFLVHTRWVRGDAEGRKEVWQALERLHGEGKARLIGLSNYEVGDVEEMKGYARVWPPHVLQIELHPWRQQRELVRYCEREGIVVQAYSPLAEGKRMDDEVLRRVAGRCSRTPAQVLLRYGLQKGWVVLPKSENPERIEENAGLYDFVLESGDMEALDDLDEDGSI